MFDEVKAYEVKTYKKFASFLSHPVGYKINCEYRNGFFLTFNLDFDISVVDFNI